MDDAFVNDTLTDNSASARFTAAGCFEATRCFAASTTIFDAATVAATGQVTGVATAAVRVSVTPQAGNTGEDRSATAARLAVVIAASIARVTTVGGMINPRIDIQFATPIATGIAAFAQANRGTAVAAKVLAGHGATRECQRDEGEKGERVFASRRHDEDPV